MDIWRDKQRMKTIFLNEKKPPYMEETEYIKLSAGQISHAVNSLNYAGKEAAATVALMILNRLGLTPAQIVTLLATE